MTLHSCFIIFTSYFYIRVLFTELLLEHFADLTAFLALLFHVLDGLVCGKQCGRTNLRTEITDTLVPGQQLEYIVQRCAVQAVPRVSMPFSSNCGAPV